MNKLPQHIEFSNTNEVHFFTRYLGYKILVLDVKY